MSFLVEMSRGAYPSGALASFAADPQFSLDDARAMMWMSQLAYETANRPKVESILGAWNLTLRAFISNDPDTGLPPSSACAVVAGGRGATIVAFSGTDPLKIEDWITDFTIVKSAEDLDSGFQAAVATVWPTISAAIENRPASEQALFFTGHSMGGALAIIAAGQSSVKATAVYTFGSPRTGGSLFASSYTPKLGDATFRLIDGADVVPTLPPPLSGEYCHVGRAMQCPTDGVFGTQALLPPDNNIPDFVDDAVQSGLADFRAKALFRKIRSIGPRPLDAGAWLLPRMVRDHVPLSYFRALAIELR